MAICAPSGFASLTKRELTVLHLIAKGCTNIQIATNLHISKYTVAQHVAKMLQRTGAANRTDLVGKAHDAGILTRTAASAAPDPGAR
jgi:LuxR family maltose regulon positive regulatory protein